MIILSLWFCSSLAEFKQELLEDEYGPRGAEDDEGLTAEEAEDGAGQGRPQETLHHPLQDETGRRTMGAETQELSSTLVTREETSVTGRHCGL